MSRVGWSRHELAARVAQDVPDGACVNLGIGIPLLVPEFLPDGYEVLFHSENGLIGLGPKPSHDAVNPDITNAAKEYATLVAGASAFDSSMSFGIIRGGHLDIAILGGMQVTPSGDLANWAAPGRTPGVGGAMDLVAGARQVWVVMEHIDRNGQAKLVHECNLPLTGKNVVDRVYTNMGVLIPKGDAFELTEVATGVTVAEVIAHSGAPVECAMELS